MTQQVKALKNLAPIEVTNEERMLQRNKLGEAFGTKKAKAAIRAQERNRVDIDALKGVTAHLQETIEENTHSLPTLGELSTSQLYCSRVSGMPSTRTIYKWSVRGHLKLLRCPATVSGTNPTSQRKRRKPQIVLVSYLLTKRTLSAQTTYTRFTTSSPRPNSMHCQWHPSRTRPIFRTGRRCWRGDIRIGSINTYTFYLRRRSCGKLTCPSTSVH